MLSLDRLMPNYQESELLYSTDAKSYPYQSFTQIQFQSWKSFEHFQAAAEQKIAFEQKVVNYHKSKTCNLLHLVYFFKPLLNCSFLKKCFYRLIGIVASMGKLLIVFLSLVYWDSDWYGVPYFRCRPRVGPVCRIPVCRTLEFRKNNKINDVAMMQKNKTCLGYVPIISILYFEMCVEKMIQSSEDKNNRYMFTNNNIKLN